MPRPRLALLGISLICAGGAGLAVIESAGAEAERGNPRLLVKLKNGGQTVRSGLANYHCLPYDFGGLLCSDGVFRPHRTPGPALRVHRNGDLLVKPGVPAAAVGGCIEAYAVSCLKALPGATTAGEDGTSWRLRLPRSYPKRTHRLRIFVRHPDGHGGSTEIRLRVNRGPDRDREISPAPDPRRIVSLRGGGPGPKYLRFRGGSAAANDVLVTTGAGRIAVRDNSGPVEGGSGTTDCVGAGTQTLDCDSGSLAFLVWSLGPEHDALSLGGAACSDFAFGGVVIAGGGNDDVSTGNAIDSVYGAAGADRIAGCGNDDRIDGGPGGDTLDGGGQEDALYGRGGADTITGGLGRDFISGGSGDDLIAGGPGRDFIRCGRGRDRVEMASGDRLARSCERRV